LRPGGHLEYTGRAKPGKESDSINEKHIAIWNEELEEVEI